MGSVTVNGKNYQGRNIIINNDIVIIDGNVVESDGKTITISIEGDIQSLNVDRCKDIKVNGNVGSLTTTSGDIEITGNTGNINTTSGDIECGNVKGSINTTSGDIECEDVGGSISTLSGDVKHRKLRND